MATTQSTTAAEPRAEVSLANDLAAKMLQGWNSHRPDSLLSVMTKDVVYEDASWPRKMRGHADVREFLESTWRAVPDLSFEFEDVLVSEDGSQFAHYWHASATQTGRWDPPGLAATGRQVKFEGLFLGEIRDGQLCRIRVVYDVATIMRQAGILPQPGSRREQLMLALANLQARLGRR